MTAPLAGTGLLARIALRTGWKGLLAWIVGLVGLFAVTGLSIRELFATPEQLAGYALALGDSMIMINGRIAGLDTAGGVVANEFAFVATFALPLMAIALVSRSTRREEEAGRYELLLSARIGRLAPLLAAVLVAAAAFVVLGLGLWAATLALDVDRSGAVLYTCSLVATGWVYAASTAVIAQIVTHARTVWMVAMAGLIATVLLRGVGDTRENWISWLSPLGWQGQVRPYGDARVWPLLLMVAVALALTAAAMWLAGRRDVDAGFVPTRTGPREASALLRTELGLALHRHSGPFVGWTVGVVALMAAYGGLMQVVMDTFAENPDLVVFLGSPEHLLDSVMQMLVRFGGFLAAGFALQALGGLRTEETTGRLELLLSGRRSRWRWLAVHTAVVAVATAALLAAGSLAFAATVSVSLDDPGQLGRLTAAGLWQLPAVAVFPALSVALFGALPRLQVLAWLPFALAVVVTMMGPTLQLTPDQIRSSPFSLVGDAPGGAVGVAGVVGLCAAAVVLVAAGLAAFRRRDVPTG